MQYTEIMQALEQYKTEGNDVVALLSAAQATLAEDGKTPLGLNQWKLTDKPRMEEFNEDNRIVDEALRELRDGKADGATVDQKLQQLNNEKADRQKNYKVTDCNTLVDPGVYSISPGSENAPTDTYCAVYVTRVNNDINYVQQLVIGMHGSMYIRVSLGNVWNAWRTVSLV